VLGDAVLLEQLVNTPALFVLSVLKQKRMVVTAELFGVTLPFNVAWLFEMLVATKVTAVGTAAGEVFAATKLLTDPYEVPEDDTATI
jgi:hypothetical protein